MNIYRIVRSLYKDAPYSYGLQGSGRWHPKGTAMIYAASSVALAMVEFVCIYGSAIITNEWTLFTYKVSVELHKIEIKYLPDNWDSRIHLKAPQEIGRQWIAGNTTSALQIPSARLPLYIYPEEFNLLINPLHPKVKDEVRFTEARPLLFHLGNWATGGKG